MKNKKEIKTKIESAVAKWDEEKTVAQYFRNKLAEEGRFNKVADNIITKATGGASTEENEIKYNELLIKIATLDQKPVSSTNIQNNTQFNLGAWAENLKE
jgi:hypothetical protein